LVCILLQEPLPFLPGDYDPWSKTGVSFQTEILMTAMKHLVSIKKYSIVESVIINPECF
jgi:hypothetical protein